MLSSEVANLGSPAIITGIRMNEISSPIEKIHRQPDISNEEKDAVSEVPVSDSVKHIIANDILNDILETAMDIAEGGEVAKNTKKSKMNIIDDQELSDSNEIKQIIHGLSNINVDQANKASPIDIEMKRMLSEMMTIGNQPKNCGIGDSPPASEEQPVAQKPSKLVEKKTRVTDLVMNSTKVLTNILNEEQRRKQDDWEEANEHVIQVIELQQSPPSNDPLYPEAFPLPYDEDDSSLLLMPPDSSQLESVDLATEDAAAGNSVGGTGDEKKEKDSKNSTLNKIGSFLNSTTKKRKWLSRLKFCSFKRNKRTPMDEGVENGEGSSGAVRD